MEVREQHVHPVKAPGQLQRERPNAGPRVEHERRCRPVPSRARHDVLPPYRAVEGPGVASEPRTPYRRDRSWPGPLPEHRHGAQQLPLLADERERRDLDLQPDTVAAAEHQPMSVGGPALLQRDLQRVSGIPWPAAGSSLSSTSRSISSRSMRPVSSNRTPSIRSAGSL